MSRDNKWTQILTNFYNKLIGKGLWFYVNFCYQLIWKPLYRWDCCNVNERYHRVFSLTTHHAALALMRVSYSGGLTHTVHLQPTFGRLRSLTEAPAIDISCQRSSRMAKVNACMAVCIDLLAVNCNYGQSIDIIQLPIDLSSTGILNIWPWGLIDVCF